MADLNVCAFVGRLTKDAELKTVGDKGTPLCKFSIANNTGFGTYAKTNYFNCQIWGKAATSLSQYLTKGKQIVVTGELTAREYNGTTYWDLTASQVTLLASPQGATEEKPTQFNIDEGKEFVW